jgi:homoserine O-acetyltransferase
VQKLFLDQLGIPELYGVIGGSLGGMQALGWALQYPTYVKRCICIAAGASLSPQALAFDIIARQEIENDPHFNTGRYHEEKQIPERGLSIARQIGHVTYLSSRSMTMKFGRGEWPVKKNMKRGKFGTHFQVESYLHHQGEKFAKRFDANSYLYLTRMMDTFDLAKEKASLAEAFNKVESQFLVVSISTDWLFPSKQQKDLVSALMENQKQVSYFTIESPYGHDAFLIEYDSLGRGVDAFLNGACPEKAALKGTRRDVDEVSRMIREGDYVLDVGSGDGAFSASLKKTKKITSVCLDVDFDAVVACMAKGLSALQLDADTGLEMIGDKAFDCVLLNQTIQQLNSALTTMKHMLRVAPVAVIGFPNFAYYKYRISIGLKGRLPVSKTLPYEWYETPNIHVVTLKDFRSLCRNNGYTIEEIVFLADDPVGKRMIRMGLEDLGSERVLAKLSRS